MRAAGPLKGLVKPLRGYLAVKRSLSGKLLFIALKCGSAREIDGKEESVDLTCAVAVEFLAFARLMYFAVAAK